LLFFDGEPGFDGLYERKQYGFDKSRFAGKRDSEKAEQVGDSVKEKLKDIKITVNAGMDSIKQAHRDTIH